MSKQRETWVCKFGGTSLANAQQILKVKEIVQADERRRVVVVSAPGKEHKDDTKVTDLLLECHRLAQQGSSIDQPFSTIRTRILAIAHALGVDESKMNKELDAIYTQLPKEKSANYAASRGEYLNAVMIAENFGSTFVDAADIIRLTDDGRVDEVTYDLAEKRLSHIDGGIVIPGFYGTGPDNNVKTFSRGGSDISGAIAARSIGASKYENWTDVSGIFIADPRIAKNAGPMDHMTYKEIRELATIGASVFHEDAIAPVRSVGVPINVKNTNDPSAKGTMITPTRDTTIDPIVGVSGEKPYRSITVDAFMLKRYPEKLKAIEGALQQHELKVDLTVDAFDTVVYYVRTEIEDDQAKALEETLLKSLDVDSVTISAQRALIGIVGEGIKAEKKLLSSVTNLLNSKGIDFEIVGQLLPVKSLISVPLENYKDALNALVDLIIGA